MRLGVWVCVLWLSVARASAAPTVEESVRGVLSAQVDAWNRRDLVGYMAGYWRSPELTFVSGSTVTRGWEAILERYRKRYQREGREMGKLDFAELKVVPLGDDAALARGRWRLQMSGGKESKGLFSLVLRRLPEGWRIVYDQSASE
jgi:beta-aspartyl-peptidase (threonine type)